MITVGFIYLAVSVLVSPLVGMMMREAVADVR